MSNPLLPGDDPQPSGKPIDDEVVSEPMGDRDVVLENESQGATASRGGGEFPDPDTPPSGSAPADGSPEHNQGQFAEAYDEEREAAEDDR
jgi:hypothetical protein